MLSVLFSNLLKSKELPPRIVDLAVPSKFNILRGIFKTLTFEQFTPTLTQAKLLFQGLN